MDDEIAPAQRVPGDELEIGGQRGDRAHGRGVGGAVEDIVARVDRFERVAALHADPLVEPLAGLHTGLEDDAVAHVVAMDERAARDEAAEPRRERAEAELAADAEREGGGQVAQAVVLRVQATFDVACRLQRDRIRELEVVADRERRGERDVLATVGFARGPAQVGLVDEPAFGVDRPLGARRRRVGDHERADDGEDEAPDRRPNTRATLRPWCRSCGRC